MKLEQPQQICFLTIHIASAFFLSRFLLSMYIIRKSRIFLAVYYRTLRVSYLKYLLHCNSKTDGVSGFRLSSRIDTLYPDFPISPKNQR